MMLFFFRKLICVFGLFFIVLSFSSCTARINGTLAADGSAILAVDMSLEPRITTLIQRLSAAGGSAGVSVLDGAAISASLSNAPGVTFAMLINRTPSAVDGAIQISRVNEFLTAADGRGIIDFRQGASGGSCRININLDNGPAILELLSPDIVLVLEALMAPVATGEKMTKTQYLNEVSMMYDRSIRDEIASSRIRTSIEFPGQITRASGGTFSGRRVDFDIPLLDILVLETPFVLEVEWRN